MSAAGREPVAPYRYPTLPDERASLFTEGIDFFSIGAETSFMGDKRDGVVALCRVAGVAGTWMDLGAGDGRYTDELLTRCERVIALDADRSALSKLWHRAPERHRRRLELVVHNAATPFAMPAASLDGVLCVGLLHYFHADLIRTVLDEVARLLRPGGSLIAELSTEVQRRPADGVGPSLERGVNHRFADAGRLLGDILAPDFSIDLHEEAVDRKPMVLRGRRFLWSSRDLYVLATKRG